jgi:hypothetical protein
MRTKPEAGCRNGILISLSHAMRPGLESAIFWWQNSSNQLGKFCFIETTTKLFIVF